MPDQPIIFWFRRNLRIADNPALHAAARTGAPVIPDYVLDKNAGSAAGAASLWWLSRSLRSHGDLRKRGSRLILRKGEFGREIKRVAMETGASAVFFTRGYEPDMVDYPFPVIGHKEGREQALAAYEAVKAARK